MIAVATIRQDVEIASNNSKDRVTNILSTLNHTWIADGRTSRTAALLVHPVAEMNSTHLRVNVLKAMKCRAVPLT